jgi:hypothetical protein
MVGPAIEVRCEAPEMLELVEAVLDAVARLVDRRVVWDRDFARSGRRNDRDHAGVRNQLAQLVAVIVSACRGIASGWTLILRTRGGACTR